MYLQKKNLISKLKKKYQISMTKAPLKTKKKHVNAVKNNTIS